MEWLTITETEIKFIVTSAILLFFILLIFIKINGLRSFAKFSTHDFAVTIAIGSILGSAVTSKNPSLLQAVLAIGILLFIQSLYSKWRIYRSKNYLENKPILLMDGPNILYENLKKTKMTENDLLSKLRESNVLNFNQVKAVVFEPSGDISVLHGDVDLEDRIIKDVLKK